MNACGFNISSSGMIMIPYPIERFVPSDFFARNWLLLPSTGVSKPMVRRLLQI